MTKMKKLYLPVLAAAAITFSIFGMPKKAEASCNTYQVNVAKGYLALRTDTAFDSKNEIGELYNGDLVEVMDYTGATGYWYVYSPKYDTFGYVNNDYLNSISSSVSAYDTMWTVSVEKGYLALRNAACYDSANEIGKLYSGDNVWVCDSSDSTYWYVYSPKLNCYGFVNQEYLYTNEDMDAGTSYFGETRMVSVAKGYLALRNMKAYDASNEIGELYTGDVVQLLETSDPKYWYVYSPKYDMNGFVNKDYLVGGSTFATKSVSVSKGYLALRSAMSYDESNEIGELYTGDVVQLLETSDPKYWYVYSPKYDMNGFVNKDYLVGGSTFATKSVSVSKGYLALRSAMSYDESNEIGELYTGDTVVVIDSSNSQYWYVYSTGLMMYGYVNKDYLY